MFHVESPRRARPTTKCLKICQSCFSKNDRFQAPVSPQKTFPMTSSRPMTKATRNLRAFWVLLNLWPADKQHYTDIKSADWWIANE